MRTVNDLSLTSLPKEVQFARVVCMHVRQKLAFFYWHLQEKAVPAYHLHNYLTRETNNFPINEKLICRGNCQLLLYTRANATCQGKICHPYGAKSMIEMQNMFCYDPITHADSEYWQDVLFQD